jgi:hypothetical protein
MRQSIWGLLKLRFCFIFLLLYSLNHKVIRLFRSSLEGSYSLFICLCSWDTRFRIKTVCEYGFIIFCFLVILNVIFYFLSIRKILFSIIANIHHQI